MKRTCVLCGEPIGGGGRMTNKTIATKTLSLGEQTAKIFDDSIKLAKPTHLMFSLRMKVIFKKFYGVKLTREEQKVFEQMEKEYNG